MSGHSGAQDALGAGRGKVDPRTLAGRIPPGGRPQKNEKREKDQHPGASGAISVRRLAVLRVFPQLVRGEWWAGPGRGRIRGDGYARITVAGRRTGPSVGARCSIASRW